MKNKILYARCLFANKAIVIGCILAFLFQYLLSQSHWMPLLLDILSLINIFCFYYLGAVTSWGKDTFHSYQKTMRILQKHGRIDDLHPAVWDPWCQKWGREAAIRDAKIKDRLR